jgi:hypothetical protein
MRENNSKNKYATKVHESRFLNLFRDVLLGIRLAKFMRCYIPYVYILLQAVPFTPQIQEWNSHHKITTYNVFAETTGPKSDQNVPGYI